MTNFRDPSLTAISKESQDWWSGIKDGSVKFIKALPLIQDFIPAYIPRHLIIVSGYTSAGKSQLLAQITAWVAGIEEANTVVFSLEDSRMERLFSLISVIEPSVHRREMILGQVQKGKSKIDSAMANITTWPLVIYDDVRFLKDMLDIVKARKPSVIVIDYVQKILLPGGIYERMSAAAHEIFDMAQNSKATVILASQISVGAAENDNPNMIPVKGAGELAEAAHSVIQIIKNRNVNSQNKVKLHIRKNKAFGVTGIIDCRFNEHWTLIEKDEEDDIPDRRDIDG